MEILSEKKIQSLKTALCAGDQSVVRAFSQHFFPEIWANILLGEIAEQEDALLLLEADLKNDWSVFCQSTLPVENYLRKQWKSKLAVLRKKTIAFDETYMSPQVIIEETNTAPKQNKQRQHQLYPFRYLLASMGPIERMLFEVKYLQELNHKNGIFQVAHFLLNAASIGHPPLRQLLQEKKVLYEPIITDYLIRQAKHAFTNQQEAEEEEESLVQLLQHLPNNRTQLKKAFHTYEMKAFRLFTAFRQKQENMKLLNVLEKAFVLINDYKKSEHVIEFWTQLNADAQTLPDLKKALKKHALLDLSFNPKHSELSGRSIAQKRSIGKKQLISLHEKITAIQEQINLKIQKKIKWTHLRHNPV